MPKFREISGQFVGYVPDGTDPDVNPDREAMNGRVTFTPVFTGGVIAFPELSPPEFAHPEPISARIIDGFVQVQVGTDDDVSMQPLSLMVTVDDEASQVWSWRAEFTNMRIGTGEVEVTIPAWSFRVPDGTGPVDLTELVPLKSGGTVDVTKGPRGAGLENITAVDGQLVFAYTDGQEATVPIPEAVQGPQGEPGPAGADGEQGPQGEKGDPGEIPDLLVGNITDATPTGKNLMLAATEGAARDAIGLQTGATSIAGSLEELNNGTQTNSRVWSPRNLAQYTSSALEPFATIESAKTYAGDAADGVAADSALINSVRVEAVLKFREYPAETSWAQAFSYDPDDEVYYIGTQGEVEYKIQRVSKATGLKLDERTFTIESGAFCESLPFWRNGSGDLCFIVRAGSGGSHSTYSVYNYTTGTLGPKIAIKGTLRAGQHGNYVVTTESWTTSVGKFHIYDWESVKSGSPALLSTVSPSNIGEIGRKNQGFQYLGGDFYLQQATVGEDPTINRYLPNGMLDSTTRWALEDFANLVNDYYPGTILDPANLVAEGEGLSYSGDRLLSGWTVNTGDAARLVIISHGHALGTKVKSYRQADTLSDTSATVSLSGASCLLNRSGQFVSVYVDGSFAPVAAGATVQIGTIPVPFRPRRTLRFFALVSNQIAMLAFYANGIVELVNISTASVGTVTTFSTVYDLSL